MFKKFSCVHITSMQKLLQKQNQKQKKQQQQKRGKGTMGKKIEQVLSTIQVLFLM